ncbi:hypothetical protein BgAZ_208130 [Babesia gibsoni]|uniref:Uncharacterized protein n=1 Tax=Babesia gibsoni TaxID=33632 RepID=A0AAD8UT07_BABGI|nr:hypothetical protein BgAZ_208130 [Babesia gibsoni]
MTLLCRVDDGFIVGNIHALCKNALVTASGDNQLALLLHNKVYLIHLRHRYAEVIGEIRSSRDDGDSPVGYDENYDPNISLDQTPENYHTQLMQVVNNACIDPSPRFVGAAWTPVAIFSGNDMVAALCTVSMSNTIEIWLPTTHDGNEFHHVEKICDVSSLIAEQLKHKRHNDVVIAGYSDLDHACKSALISLQCSGIKICQFAEPPYEDRENGFFGCISCYSNLILVWFSAVDAMKTGDGMNFDCNTVIEPGDGQNSEDEGQVEMTDEFVNTIYKHNLIDIYNKKAEVQSFNPARIAQYLSISASQTICNRLSCRVIGLLNTGFLSSFTVSFKRSSSNTHVYEIFMGCDDGQLKKTEIEVNTPPNVKCIKISDIRTLLELTCGVDKLRYYTFHGDTGEHSLLLSIVDKAILVYDVMSGKHSELQCGSNTLISYQTEPLFMNMGMIARIAILDAIGTTYFITVDPQLKLHTECEKQNEKELFPIYINDAGSTFLHVYVGGSSIELHSSLRSRNIFAILITLMATKCDLSAFSDVIEFHASVEEWEVTESMFSMEESDIENTLYKMTQKEFFKLAKTHDALKLWREFLSMLSKSACQKKELVATLLYLIAYADAGGDTMDKISIISIEKNYLDIVRRNVEKLEVSTYCLKHMTSIAKKLYRNAVIDELINFG